MISATRTGNCKHDVFMGNHRKNRTQPRLTGINLAGILLPVGVCSRREQEPDTPYAPRETISDWCRKFFDSFYISVIF
ncbi:MAG: hypothetical protein A4E33_01741 [Methanoregula sp. PtaB.Bin085]|nr:MAG: hypothetical protein A4E33_01741 [Methanoregula sp. PtaB.Bin085]